MDPVAASFHPVGVTAAISIRIPDRNSYSLDRSIAARAPAPELRRISVGERVGPDCILYYPGPVLAPIRLL